MAAERSRTTEQKTKQEVDLKRCNQPQNQERYRDPNTLGINLPAEVPVYMRCFRLMEGVDTDINLRGWTVQLDAWSFGVTVYLKVTKDGNLTLICEDDEGRQKLVEWTK